MKIIDVSHWQNHVDWQQVSNDEVIGTYIKATEGSENGTAFIDKQMDDNIKGARQNGLHAGFYHFARFVSENDAINEANWFIKQIKGYDFTLIPMLDIEQNNCSSYNEMNKGIRAFLKCVEKELGSVGLYSFGTFFNAHVDRSLIERYAYWHARYNDNPVNVPLDKLYLWQFTNKGVVDGINGFVDVNETGGNFFTLDDDVNIQELVKKTIRGEFGNGQERKDKLGKYYDDVQKIINS